MTGHGANDGSRCKREESGLSSSPGSRPPSGSGHDNDGERDVESDGELARGLGTPHLAGLESLTYGDGLALSLNYDGDGRLTDMRAADGTLR